MLEDSWELIQKEALNLLDDKRQGFVTEDENLREKGDWKQFNLYIRGKKLDQNCKKAPITCSLIDKILPAKTCTRGQVKFSVMLPGGVHVWPHCGPTNCRLRAHLGLKIPDGGYIRVANETRQWIEGKVIVFDDSFEHEVWYNGDSIRLVLIIDVWHPDLGELKRNELSPI